MTDTQFSLIEVMAPHCVECRAMQPDLDAVASEFQGRVDLEIVNAAEEPDRAASMNILGTPTLIGMRDGVEVARFTGRRSRAELRALFASIEDGSTDGISPMSRCDRFVLTLAGALLITVGLLLGPSWVLVGLGAALAAVAILRGRI